MPSANVQCPFCGKSVVVPDAYSGQLMQCPHCGNAFVAPDASNLPRAELPGPPPIETAFKTANAVLSNPSAYNLPPETPSLVDALGNVGERLSRRREESDFEPLSPGDFDRQLSDARQMVEEKLQAAVGKDVASWFQSIIDLVNTPDAAPVYHQSLAGKIVEGARDFGFLPVEPPGPAPTPPSPLAPSRAGATSAPPSPAAEEAGRIADDFRSELESYEDHMAAMERLRARGKTPTPLQERETTESALRPGFLSLAGSDEFKAELEAYDEARAALERLAERGKEATPFQIGQLEESSRAISEMAREHGFVMESPSRRTEEPAREEFTAEPPSRHVEPSASNSVGAGVSIEAPSLGTREANDFRPPLEAMVPPRPPEVVAEPPLAVVAHPAVQMLADLTAHARQQAEEVEKGGFRPDLPSTPGEAQEYVKGARAEPAAALFGADEEDYKAAQEALKEFTKTVEELARRNEEARRKQQGDQGQQTQGGGFRMPDRGEVVKTASTVVSVMGQLPVLNRMQSLGSGTVHGAMRGYAMGGPVGAALGGAAGAASDVFNLGGAASPQASATYDQSFELLKTRLATAVAADEFMNVASRKIQDLSGTAGGGREATRPFMSRAAGFAGEAPGAVSFAGILPSVIYGMGKAAFSKEAAPSTKPPLQAPPILPGVGSGVGNAASYEQYAQSFGLSSLNASPLVQQQMQEQLANMTGTLKLIADNTDALKSLTPAWR